jgi:hypothetical protein
MTDAWMLTYDAVFFISIGTLMCGGFALIVKYCFKSKCENVQLCGGLIKIKRRVDLEISSDDEPTDESLLTAQSTETGLKGKATSRLRRPSVSLTHPKKNLPHREKKLSLQHPDSLKSHLDESSLQKDPPAIQAYQAHQEDLSLHLESDSNEV